MRNRIILFVYKEPGEETSLVVIVNGEEVPIYSLEEKD